jgi:hypothetical protein
VTATTREWKPFVLLGEIDGGVVVREVMKEASTNNSRDPIGIETEEVHSWIPVERNVRSKIEFGVWDSRPGGEYLWSDIDVRKLNDRQPRLPIICIEGQSFREVWLNKFRIDWPIGEENVPPSIKSETTTLPIYA